MNLLAEHMLFYASEKYPGEQDYTKYISEVPCVNQLQENIQTIFVHHMFASIYHT
jgi:secreted Zn-dependent insulinase-like peptidase